MRVRSKKSVLTAGCGFLPAVCAAWMLLPGGAHAQTVRFERSSGDEFFYTLRKDDGQDFKVTPGDRLIFSGTGVVKGLVPPFRPAAQESNGGWHTAKESCPGRVVFEASLSAQPGQDIEEGFVLLGRMGVSPPGNSLPKAVIQYEYAGEHSSRSGEVPGPAEK